MGGGVDSQRADLERPDCWLVAHRAAQQRAQARSQLQVADGAGKEVIRACLERPEQVGLGSVRELRTITGRFCWPRGGGLVVRLPGRGRGWSPAGRGCPWRVELSEHDQPRRAGACESSRRDSAVRASSRWMAVGGELFDKARPRVCVGLDNENRLAVRLLVLGSVSGLLMVMPW